MKSLKKIVVTLCCCGLFFVSKATHNRAGEISYIRIAPFTEMVGGVKVPVYTYSITLTKYTDHGQSIADRCIDTIYFGDGERGIAPRINTDFFTGCLNPCGTFNGTFTIKCGELLVNEATYKVKKNVYTIIHTYPGPGSYKIYTADRNRNMGVKNIPNSINQAFYVEALLIVNSFSGSNSSPVLTFPPIDRACSGQCFEHNPGAYDPDGTDSLSFEITTSRTFGGQTVPGYTYPNAGQGGSYGIDPITGKLSWCVPVETGEYNLAFIVKEWRKNTSGVYVIIGHVLRDMQVVVSACDKNKNPVMVMPEDICVEAGTLIHKQIIVSDPNDGNFVTVTANGGPFVAANPKATIQNTLSVTHTATAGFIVDFDWQTTCDHIQPLPYNAVFKAEDNGTPNGSIPKLATYTNFFIQVVPPVIKNVTATPFGTAMTVSWSPATCNPIKNPVVFYRVYRKDDCSPISFDCDTKLSNLSELKLVGQTIDGQTNTLTDYNNGDGLIVGKNYSYIVVAVYDNGIESFGSAQVCASLKRDVPVMLNVDVLTTAENGSIKIKWLKPLTTVGNLDTNQLQGPYQYNLKHKVGSDYVTIFNSTKAVFSHLDLSYTHTNVNTTVGNEEYYLEFIAGTSTVGVSHKATSVFLTTKPGDRKIDLTWNSKTPWTNYKYSIWRKDPSTTTFTLIADVTETSYTDEKNIDNEKTYCYYVVSQGEYSDNSIQRPLLNASQESCASATDLTPPVTPSLNIEADCVTGFVKVNWNGIENIKGSDDVSDYSLYFKPTINDVYSKIAVIKKNEPLVYVFDGTEISGCYAIESKDINGNKSALSPDFCVDNCPIFELPNVFTPNGDGVNDFFKAIRVRQIKSIDLYLYDRWGNLVFKTKDPYFNWDGLSIISKQPVSEGAFFYVCDVFEPRLKGIVKRSLKGGVEVVR